MLPVIVLPAAATFCRVGVVVIAPISDATSAPVLPLTTPLSNTRNLSTSVLGLSTNPILNAPPTVVFPALSNSEPEIAPAVISLVVVLPKEVTSSNV